jgi:hypothetical protein
MKTIMDLAREAKLPACHLDHPKALQRFADLLAQRDWQPTPSSLPLTLGQLQPGQWFILLRDKRQFQVLRHKRQTYGGTLDVVVRQDPSANADDGDTEFAFHHSCHVRLITTHD